MDWLTLSDCPPYDGRYEFELFEKLLTIRECGWLKRYAGEMPRTYLRAMANGDQEVIGVCTAITLIRSGKADESDFDEIWQRLLDTRVGSIRLEVGDREDVTAPLPENSNGSPTSSGANSPITSASSDSDPRSTGTPDSDTSESDQPTLVG